MGVLEVIVILAIVIGAIVGFKRGFTREIVSFVGMFAIIILAFILKNYVSVFMYENLPFFPFSGVLKGVTVLNIAVYEVIAFFIVLGILGLLLKILLFITKIFESILKFTVILSIPSKLLGSLVGMLEGYVISFIIIYLLTLPIFNYSFVQGSTWRDPILSKTPILSGYVSDSKKIFDEFALLKEQYKDNSNAREFNLATLNLFLKYKVITVESAEKLIEKGKIDIDKAELYKLIEMEG